MTARNFLPSRARLRDLRDRIVPHGVILMYHSIGSTRHDPWQLCVSPENFAQQLEVLRRRTDIVPLSGLQAALSRSSRRRPPVAITFDDGYVDNLLQARPILERFAAPATVFVATGRVGLRREYWSDRLARIVLGAVRLPATLSLEIDDQFVELAARHLGSEALLTLLWRRLRVCTEVEQERTLTELQRLLQTADQPDATRFPMSAEQIRELARDGLVDIGAHTRSHCQLTPLLHSQQMHEIAGSKSDCESILGRSIAHFAYPYGWYDATSIECVKKAGFDLACTTVAQPVTGRADNYRLPRFAVKDQPGEVFERRVAARFSPFM